MLIPIIHKATACSLQISDKMAFLSLVFLAFAFAVGRVFAYPQPFDNSTVVLDKRSIPNVIGTFDGYYYSVYAESSVTGEHPI